MGRITGTVEFCNLLGQVTVKIDSHGAPLNSDSVAIGHRAARAASLVMQGVIRQDQGVTHETTFGDGFWKMTMWGRWSTVWEASKAAIAELKAAGVSSR